MYNHLLNINNKLVIKMLLSDENKQKNTDRQFSFLLLFVFTFFSFSNGVYGLLFKNTVKTKLTNQSRIKSFIKKAHNR